MINFFPWARWNALATTPSTSFQSARQLDDTSDSKLCEGICIQPALTVGQIDVSCNWTMHRRMMSPQTHYG